MEKKGKPTIDQNALNEIRYVPTTWGGRVVSPYLLGAIGASPRPVDKFGLKDDASKLTDHSGVQPEDFDGELRLDEEGYPIEEDR